MHWPRHTPVTDPEFILTLFFIQVAITIEVIKSPAFLPASSSCPLGSFIFLSFFIQNSRNIFPTVTCDGGDIFSSANSWKEEVTACLLNLPHNFSEQQLFLCLIYLRTMHAPYNISWYHSKKGLMCLSCTGQRHPVTSDLLYHQVMPPPPFSHCLLFGGRLFKNLWGSHGWSWTPNLCASASWGREKVME